MLLLLVHINKGETKRIVTPTDDPSIRTDEWNKLLRIIKRNHRNYDKNRGSNVGNDPISQMYTKELDKMFKPGYQNDPVWLGKSAELRVMINQNRVKAREEFMRMK